MSAETLNRPGESVDNDRQAAGFEDFFPETKIDELTTLPDLFGVPIQKIRQPETVEEAMMKTTQTVGPSDVDGD